ncbi:tartrate dehydrogenase [Peribacillus cavernae]|uniref:D-malate dehydrogenase (decarboxylating) n=1 Tax=Peribacillus cavernae TaxID=1674310 RepID=A0A3S0VH22_9BACI|nr:tartrate dehydrogenase [Peribacillus cavernae]MDQ0219265.1 tartrate dehydrogenase/decarboxylase/D-malate dehydrogenase [Peribacillus cavernae]RUQ27838.1 tartrate dehydrogenase [Peribacillus cavernae]
MQYYSLAVIPGDGVGPEVMKEALNILHVIEELHGGMKFDSQTFDWNCDYYVKHGNMMPANGLEILQDFDAILFGAVGSPLVPDHISVWELILPIRRRFEQYVNMRPIKLLHGLESPLRNKGHDDLDFVVIRENTEGEYTNMGGRLYQGLPYEMALQNNVFTRFGTERIIQYAYDYAEHHRRKNVTAATKSNAMNFTMTFWDEIVKEVSGKYPDIHTNLYHVDALAAYFVTSPERFDVVVASNLFGDILSDLGGAIVGGLGIGPSGNINPEKKYPSMFEPVHGSAPDIAGKGIANPIAQIWSVAMMLDHLGFKEAYDLILDSIEKVLIDGVFRTPDLGGDASTRELGNAIANTLKKTAGIK